VSEEARAKTMRDLPEPDINMPEVSVRRRKEGKEGRGEGREA
jgi:hypothetical protein